MQLPEFIKDFDSDLIKIGFLKVIKTVGRWLSLAWKKRITKEELKVVKAEDQNTPVVITRSKGDIHVTVNGDNNIITFK